MRIACAPQTFVAFMFLKWASSVHYIPERTLVSYVNEKYAYNGSANIRRYDRKSPYYYNIQAGIRHTWGNNITVHMLFFEYQHNQYRRSFVELHLKLCDMLQRDPYFGKIFSMVLAKYKIACPVPAGMYVFRNITLPSEGIPNILPFEKGKVEVNISQLPTQDLITTIYVWFHIKQ
ncbi:hypothetical protein MSG28_004598 [Choristoneura fumiferana]|uniref:Uncharacterized protein n=1 Tax=Choristoneura fumiferana TaxID=7141 RepID=A0ACC0K6M2_CHOFU|nr:hypothetical protein MSG28_004598 [Choristoneura fumiferana]